MCTGIIVHVHCIYMSGIALYTATFTHPCILAYIPLIRCDKPTAGWSVCRLLRNLSKCPGWLPIACLTSWRMNWFASLLIYTARGCAILSWVSSVMRPSLYSSERRSCNGSFISSLWCIRKASLAALWPGCSIGDRWNSVSIIVPNVSLAINLLNHQTNQLRLRTNM